MTERRQHARERRNNIVVGLTALGGLAGLIVLLMAFGYVPSMLRGGYEVTVYTSNIAGVNKNSRVTLWGQDIGEVTEVGLSEVGAPERTYMKLMIDDRFTVPRDVSVRLETPLFGGGPVVALVGSGPGQPTLATDGSAVIASAQVIDPLAQLEAVSREVSGLSSGLNSLLTRDVEGEPSLSRVVLKLEQRLDGLETVLAGAEQWLGDEKLRADVTQTADNAHKLSETLTETVASLEERYAALADAAEARLEKVDRTLDTAIQTLDGAGDSIGEIETRYVALADEASKVIAVVDKLVARADSKDSTVGLLLSDPQLYRNLTDTSERLKLMTDEARLLIEKWKAEGLPLRVFN